MTVGIANNPTKKQQSRTMNMCYFWVVDQANLNNVCMIWAPGLDNLADYFIKHHLASHHKTFRPYYFSCPTSPRTLARVPSPSSLQEYVKFSNSSYQHGMSPLAQPPQYTWHTWTSSAESRLMVHSNMHHGQTAQSSHFPPAVGSVVGHLGPCIHRCPAMTKSDTRIPSILEHVVNCFQWI